MKEARTVPCDFCDGRLESGTVTVDWRRKERLVVIEGVPALVCDRCGERYYTAAAMRRMAAIGRSPRAARRAIKVPVAQFEVPA